MKILKRKTLAALLALSLLASLLPLGAQPALAAAPGGQVIYVGNVNVTSGGYWTTDSDGSVTQYTEEGTPSNNYIHYNAETNTLTLNNATIKKGLDYNEDIQGGTYILGSAIGVFNESGAAELTITLAGTNTIEDVSTGIFVLAHSSSTGDATLTITGSGSLTASGSLNGIQVQSNGDNATLTIQNADVTLTSNSGNGVTVQAGSTNSSGGHTITLSVEGGSLTASGSTGISFDSASSYTVSATNLTVSNNAIVRANDVESNISNVDLQIGKGNNSSGGIVFDGNQGTVYGSVTLQEDLTIESGQTLDIPSGASLDTNGKLTVDGGTLTQNGTVTGDIIYKVTGVSLNEDALNLFVGDSQTLTATVQPSNANNKTVTWESSNTDVATVSNGKVTAVGAGTADITVKTQDGEKIATCAVTVTAKTYSLSVDKSTLNFGSITEGDALPAAQTVTVKNTGNQSVTLVQPTAENFEIGKLFETTLEPDETATFTIQPKDKLPRGSYSEQIVVSNTNDEKVIITATFTVKEPPYTGKYSYELTTSVGDHGSLTVDRYATEGDEVTITVTPDEAYKLDDLSVTAGGKEVALTAGGDGTFSFTMPSADVKISATFAEDPDWTEPEEPATDVSDIFLDIAPNAWYKDAVQYAYAGGLMTGVSAHEFAPEATTTRAMIVSMLARLEGVESAESAGFNDVAANDWYATAVNWAAASGITSGTGDGNFSPNTAITREQLAAILRSYAEYKGQDVSARATLDTYNDATAISSWANDVMSWAVAEGLLTGVTNDQLQPQGNATRAQVAAILQRFLDN